MTDEDILREKIEHGFIPCFHEGCSRHEHCLRWLGRTFVDSGALAVTSVNTANPAVGGEACPMYRHNEKVRMALGFTTLLDQQPRSAGKALMRSMVSVSNRTYAYEYRNGSRPIPPALQQHIILFCRQQGWQGDVVFDAYDEQYAW